MMSNGVANNNGSGSGVVGPCGACKFLRRKCVKSCIFAPYFDPDQGTTHFAAVHKVFGASNASKLLLHIPTHLRFDAVLSLCYEALARLRDPVYGCLSHIFTLQHQVLNLQAELAYVQARLSTLQHQPFVPQPQSTSSTTTLHSSSDLVLSSDLLSKISFDHPFHLQNPVEMTSNLNSILLDRQILEDGDPQALVQELVYQCLPKVRFPPSTFD